MHQRSRSGIRVEWPTLILILGNFLLFAGLTANWQTLPLWLVLPLLIMVLTLYASLQHEALHGHPTADPRLNALLAGLPLALWLPYGIYRRDHLQHHATAHLADPREDPECWRPMRAPRLFDRVFATLAGRLLFGPPRAALAVWRQAVADILAGDRQAIAIWLWHLPASALVLAWLIAHDVSLPIYILAAVWPSAALTQMRAYFEHRPAADNREASIIVERGGLFAFLYLNNNLHALHHAQPGMPWYALPGHFRRNREAILAANGGFRRDGYGTGIRESLLRPLPTQL